MGGMGGMMGGMGGMEGICVCTCEHIYTCACKCVNIYTCVCVYIHLYISGHFLFASLCYFWWFFLCSLSSELKVVSVRLTCLTLCHSFHSLHVLLLFIASFPSSVSLSLALSLFNSFHLLLSLSFPFSLSPSLHLSFQLYLSLPSLLSLSLSRSLSLSLPPFPFIFFSFLLCAGMMGGMGGGAGGMGKISSYVFVRTRVYVRCILFESCEWYRWYEWYVLSVCVGYKWLEYILLAQKVHGIQGSCRKCRALVENVRLLINIGLFFCKIFCSQHWNHQTRNSLRPSMWFFEPR